jgi:hypothetical protein
LGYDGAVMTGNYDPLEQYLRALPVSQDKVTLTFEHIDQILTDPLPPSARTDRDWWGNQKQGTQVEIIAWMNAGWMVETVDFREKWVRFVRQ